MKLWLVEPQTPFRMVALEAAVIAAPTQEAARATHPTREQWDGKADLQLGWPSVDQLKVTLIGDAEPSVGAGVVLFNYRDPVIDD